MSAIPLTSAPLIGACTRRWMPMFIYEALPVAPESGPSLITSPQLNGLAVVGRPVTYTPGSFSASETITLYLQWTLDGANIEGATGSIYTPIDTDVGKHLALKEIASTGFGEDCVGLTLGAVVLAIPATSVPASPTNVTLVPQGNGELLVAWTAPEIAADGTPVAPLSAINIYHNTVAGQARLGGSGVTAVSVLPINVSRLLTGLAAGTHYVTVSAANANGEGWESAEVSAPAT